MRRTKYKEILKRLERIENTLLAVHDHMNDCAKSKVNQEPERTTSEMLQEGIDSIMGYQWPPKRGGNE